MAKDRVGIFRYIYGIFLALLTVFVGALFIMQTWSIYRSAPQSPYTAESISKHFNEIAIPVWIWLGAIVGNIILSLIFTETEKKPKAYVDVRVSLQRAKKRLPTQVEYWEEIDKAEKRGVRLRTAVCTVSALCMFTAAVVCFAVLFDLLYTPLFKTAFFSSHNAVADRTVQCVIISMAALTVACIAGAINAHSRRKEQKAYLQILVDSKQPKPQEEEKAPVVEESVVKEEPKAEDKTSLWKKFVTRVVLLNYFGVPHSKELLNAEAKKLLDGEQSVEEPVVEEVVEEPIKEKPKVMPKALLPQKEREKKERPKARLVGLILARVGIALAGVALVVVGIVNGGMKDVLLKAINICTQCIGLG